MNIVWVSANIFGYELLKEAGFVKGADIKAVITLSKRSKTVMYDGIDNKRWYELKKKVFEIDDIAKEEKLFRSLRPDLVVVCGWRQVMPGSILKIPKFGVIGFHPTLLPYGRGSAPIINTILKGDSASGVTMFYISSGIDDGDIIAQKRFKISPDDHAGEVYEKVIASGKALIKRYLPDVIKGRAERKPQDNAGAVVFDKPSLKDNKIDPDTDSPETIYRKIRALSRPYKGAYIEKDGKRIIIWRAQLQDIK